MINRQPLHPSQIFWAFSNKARRLSDTEQLWPKHEPQTLRRHVRSIPPKTGKKNKAVRVRTGFQGQRNWTGGFHQSKKRMASDWPASQLRGLSASGWARSARIALQAPWGAHHVTTQKIQEWATAANISTPFTFYALCLVRLALVMVVVVVRLLLIPPCRKRSSLASLLVHTVRVRYINMVDRRFTSNIT